MTGSSVFDYVHTADHAELAQQLGLTLASSATSVSVNNQAATAGSSSAASTSHQQLPPSPASPTGSADDANSCMNPDG